LLLVLLLSLTPTPVLSRTFESSTASHVRRGRWATPRPQFRTDVSPRLSSYGENNFGDIMGGCETHVTIDGSLLPMERVALTANGNLQRIMSAHYDAPVYVHVLKCDRLNATTFDRHVNLVVDGRTFCTAVGVIELYSDECVRAVEEKNVGVGQLFRYLGVLPSFRLHHAGRRADGSLWRDYELSCAQLRCRFVESFAPHFLDFTSGTPPPAAGAGAGAGTAAAAAAGGAAAQLIEQPANVATFNGFIDSSSSAPGRRR
jgi:hypothetical protein